MRTTLRIAARCGHETHGFAVLKYGQLAMEAFGLVSSSWSANPSFRRPFMADALLIRCLFRLCWRDVERGNDENGHLGMLVLGSGPVEPENQRQFIDLLGDCPGAIGYRFNRPSRAVTLNPCASRLSDRASTSADGPIAARLSGVIRASVVRLRKSSTPSPEANRAERAVGSTWLGPPT